MRIAKNLNVNVNSKGVSFTVGFKRIQGKSTTITFTPTEISDEYTRFWCAVASILYAVNSPVHTDTHGEMVNLKNKLVKIYNNKTASVESNTEDMLEEMGKVTERELTNSSLTKIQLKTMDTRYLKYLYTGNVAHITKPENPFPDQISEGKPSELEELQQKVTELQNALIEINTILQRVV